MIQPKNLFAGGFILFFFNTDGYRIFFFILLSNLTVISLRFLVENRNYLLGSFAYLNSDYKCIAI